MAAMLGSTNLLAHMQEDALTKPIIGSRTEECIPACVKHSGKQYEEADTERHGDYPP
ncbi:hypothetical protein [Sphingobium subterraneum]|uniref:Uncharacterized protein n=1 Tax=Sphingobium subterraneum TaxID=627688 RepID=A0A841IXD5_9SPHN|nr:hypothetical protein [Sphingobium subterraneum]MBB6123609.1 hypothetical protein [Sphingobium subterraneum]